MQLMADVDLPIQKMETIEVAGIRELNVNDLYSWVLGAHLVLRSNWIGLWMVDTGRQVLRKMHCQMSFELGFQW